MPIDIPNLLLGLCLAATPLLAVLWQWQRRLQLLQQERLLLDERLSTTQLALDGFSVQLEDSRAEAARLGEVMHQAMTMRHDVSASNQ